MFRSFTAGLDVTAAILALQVVLPLLLIVWLGFFPAGSLAGFAVQAAGIGAFLFALARIAQWALPAWWLPRVYGALWLLAVVVHASAIAGAPVWPVGAPGWAGLSVAMILLGLGAGFGAAALAGRRPPPVTVVDIANPFGAGQFLVGHGGGNRLVNGHLKTLDPRVERFRQWRGQSYALDFFGLGPWGLRAAGWHPSDPAAYAIFGAELRAPCAGTVRAAESGMPDFEVPRQDSVNRLGNHVILSCGDAEIVFAHMRQGSVQVAPGDVVAIGDRLGEAGNSGASTEPHLHIHAQRPAADGDPPLSGAPLALRIDGRFLVRGDRLKTGA